MSPPESQQRAIELLEQQLTELASIRNATSRDPSFKNWRQGTLTAMERIWPGDQTRFERFRRIPFSPADPRADARAVREWYSRGCQEGGRVLNGFLEEIRAQGVPEAAQEVLPEAKANEFEDGIPTVDLPAGDIGASTSAADLTENMLAELADSPPQGSDPGFQEPARLQIEMPPSPAPPSPPPSAAEAPIFDARPSRKPRNMKSRLRDLLGFAQLSAKALTGYPRESADEFPAAPHSPRVPHALEMQPLGDEVTPASLPSPPRLSEPTGAPPIPPPHEAVIALFPSATRGVVTPREAAPAEPPAQAPPSGLGNSVTMSRPTTLRASIEKVSIDSLISAEFRSAGIEPTPGSNPPSAPAWPPAEDPDFEPGHGSESGPGSFQRPTPEPAVTNLGVPVTTEPPTLERAATPSTGPATEAVTDREAEPAIEAESAKEEELAKEEEPAVDAAFATDPESSDDAPVDEAAKVDPEAFARATEDFMRLSPVLGATGRRVRRTPAEDQGFGDADAIAVATMAQDLTRMGVPSDRQPEARARLMELAHRLERGELEWGSLRRAVWFAMEYPEIARRLVPVLLPWIDRAA